MSLYKTSRALRLGCNITTARVEVGGADNLRRLIMDGKIERIDNKYYSKPDCREGSAKYLPRVKYE